MLPELFLARPADGGAEDLTDLTFEESVAAIGVTVLPELFLARPADDTGAVGTEISLGVSATMIVTVLLDLSFGDEVAPSETLQRDKFLMAGSGGLANDRWIIASLSSINRLANIL